MSLQALVMNLLRDNGDNYGLGIIERLRNDGHNIWFAEARVYPLLSRLEREGILRSYPDFTHANVRGGNPRVYYAVTDRGKVYDY